MKIFLDTCSLFKLYHKETGTEELEKIFSRARISKIVLSELTKIEFTSTVWKKVRTKEISDSDALDFLEMFESDFEKYTFVVIDSAIVEKSRLLISRYGKQGLRTLDSIQLSTCVSLIKEVDVFLTSDKLLKSMLDAEGLATEL